jgi:hypothetical protein
VITHDKSRETRVRFPVEEHLRNLTVLQVQSLPVLANQHRHIFFSTFLLLLLLHPGLHVDNSGRDWDWMGRGVFSVFAYTDDGVSPALSFVQSGAAWHKRDFNIGNTAKDEERGSVRSNAIARTQVDINRSQNGTTIQSDRYCHPHHARLQHSQH